MSSTSDKSRSWANSSPEQRRKAMQEALGSDKLSPEQEALLHMQGDVVVRRKPAKKAEEPGAFTPQQIAEVVETELVARRVGELLATARAQSGKSLSELGKDLGVTRGRVAQLEHADNLNVDTLVRFASALGYRVRLRLEREGGALEAVLGDSK